MKNSSAKNAKVDYTPKAKKEEYPRFASKKLSPQKRISPISEGYVIRETPVYQSRTTPGGSTAPKEFVKYTGDEMIGTTIVHKSCIQPIFRKEEAVDAAHMRR